MKFGLLFFLVINSAVCLAAGKSKITAPPPDKVTLQDFEKLNVTQDANLGLKFFVKNIGLRMTDDTKIHNVFYANIKMNKWVLVQANMSVVDKKNSEITTTEDGKSYFSVKGKANFFVLSRGLQRDEVIKLQKSILGSISGESKKTSQHLENPSPMRNFAEMLFRGTQAQAAPDKKCLNSDDILKKLDSKNESDFKALQATASCLNGAGAGVYAATVGAVVYFFSEALTKGSEQILCFGARGLRAAGMEDAPWRRCDEYAEAMQTTIDSTMYTVSHLQETTDEVLAGIAALPANVKAKVICEIAGSAVSGVAVTLGTGGAGAPFALSKIADAMEAVSKSPGIGENKATLAAMAAKLRKKSLEKPPAVPVAASPMPADLKSSLAKMAGFKEIMLKKAREMDEKKERIDFYTKKFDVAVKERDTAALGAAESEIGYHNGLLKKMRDESNNASADLTDEVTNFTNMLDKKTDLSAADKEAFRKQAEPYAEGTNCFVHFPFSGPRPPRYYEPSEGTR